MLNPSLPRPLYLQLADELASGMRKGLYATGTRIPSEHELARRYRLGRPTVRQATELLVRRGLLERRRGAGTFVSSPREEVDLFTLSGTLAAFEGSGLDLETRVVEPVKLRKAPETPGNPFAGKRAYTFVRLGRVEKTPVLLEHLFLDPDVFPALSEQKLGASLSRSIADRYGIHATGGRQSFRVEAVGAERAAMLEVPRTSAQLFVRRWLDFAGAPYALYAEMVCRTDRVQLTQSLHPSGSVFPPSV